MRSTYLNFVGASLVAGLLLSCPSYADDGENRKVDIVNDTSVTMVEFYASTIDIDEWEEDILGSQVLRPNNEITINIDDGSGYCLYDLKAVFADGDVVTEKMFNVCEEPYWRIND